MEKELEELQKMPEEQKTAQMPEKEAKWPNMEIARREEKKKAGGAGNEAKRE